MNTINKQQGMTLVELMIAGALGVLVTFFIMNIMITSGRTAIQSEGLAQAQENGRFILSWLHTEGRRAGFVPGIVIQRIQPFADLCPSGSPMPPADGGDCTFESNNQISDRLAIRRTYTNEVRERLDCTGTNLNGIRNEGDILTDVYWVERDFSQAGVPTDDAYDDVLRCVTYFNGVPQAPAQVIASGVEGMQVLYGIRPEEDLDRRTNVSRYTQLNQLPQPVDWDTVRALRVAVLTRSFGDNALPEARRSYILLDADPMTFTDQIARHIQSVTVFLPNE